VGQHLIWTSVQARGKQYETWGEEKPPVGQRQAEMRPHTLVPTKDGKNAYSVQQSRKPWRVCEIKKRRRGEHGSGRLAHVEKSPAGVL